MTPGIYLVHKAVHQTSFSLVQNFMEEVRLEGIRRDKLPVCHGGALDPFAEGLLLLLAGQATRLMDLLHPIPKTYVAEIAWGAETDNGDLFGKRTRSAGAVAVTAAQIEAAARSLLGWQEQVPPSTSNKRVDGERAYRKAHRGERVVLPASRVYLHSVRWLAHELPAKSTVELTTGGGYYVRAFARDLGRATGAFAHLTRLRRTAIGPWSDPGGARVHLSGEELFPWCPSVEIGEGDRAALRAGRGIEPRPLRAPSVRLPDGFPDPAAPVRALVGGRIVAMLREREGRLVGAPVLRGPL